MIYPILNKHNLFVICIVICLEAESHEIEDNKILHYGKSIQQSELVILPFL